MIDARHQLTGHPVMDDQPTLRNPQRRWTGTDLQRLERVSGHGEGPEVAQMGQPYRSPVTSSTGREEIQMPGRSSVTAAGR